MTERTRRAERICAVLTVTLLAVYATASVVIMITILVRNP